MSSMTSVYPKRSDNDSASLIIFILHVTSIVTSIGFLIITIQQFCGTDITHKKVFDQRKIVILNAFSILLVSITLTIATIFEGIFFYV